MFKKHIISGMLAVLAISITLHAQEFKIGSKDVQVHGFGTQGFVHTNDNNWLTMNTSGTGSGAFTDAGLNLGAQITSNFRVGGQVYDRKLGQLGDWHPLLDWAMGDYRLKPWLGFRAGKVKTVLGLFTDSQDMDFANTFALLPQSVYPIDLRDASIAHLGGDIYGREKLGHNLGSIAYTAYGGRRSDNMHSGYPYLLSGIAGITLNSYGGPVFGGDLRWNPPVRGLTVGISRLNEMITGKGSYNGQLGIPAQPKYWENSKHDWTNQYYGRFVKDKLHAESEYRRYLRDQIIFSGLSWVETDIRGWYVGGGYQVNKWLEAGSYYSHYRIFPSGGAGVNASYPDAQTHDFDKVVTAKLTLKQYVTVKVEGHFMDGNGSALYPAGFYSNVNPNGFSANTNALVGVRDTKVGSRGPASLPVVLKLAVELAAAQGNNRVGAANCPEHAGLLEARADDGFASRLDDAGADKQVLAAKLWVAHTLGVSLKIVRLDAQLLDDFGIGCIDGAKREDKFFDLSLVQQALMFFHPGFLFHGVIKV